MNYSLLSKRLTKTFQRVLCISDLHAPYSHIDTVRFLSAIKQSLRPDLVVYMGDEVDQHSLSYHEHDPDLHGAGAELAEARRFLARLYRLFPKAYVLDSNHGSLVARKAYSAGLPSEVLRSAAEVVRAPSSYSWVADLTINTPLGRVFFTHGKTPIAGKLSKNMAMSCVQGHYHTRFYIDYWGSPAGLFWDMNVSCLVDDKSRAMAYNKITMQRPIIGVGAIVGGKPQLIPMHLTTKGRWTGVL